MLIYNMKKLSIEEQHNIDWLMQKHGKYINKATGEIIYYYPSCSIFSLHTYYAEPVLLKYSNCKGMGLTALSAYNHMVDKIKKLNK